MQTIEQFIAKSKVRLASIKSVSSNPNMTDMPVGSKHYKCVLRCKRKQMTVFFSMGSGLRREPTTKDLLDCMASDCAGLLYGSFEEWADDLGFDPNSQKALKTYQAMDKQAKRLENLLEPDMFKELLYKTKGL